MADWGSCVIDEAASIQCLVPLFENVVRAFLSLAGVALFIMLIVAGYNFLFAGGDQKKLERARGTLTGAITGLVVIVLAYLILRLIAAVTGVDVTTFKLEWPGN